MYPEKQLVLIRSYLWENTLRKVFFSTHRTSNTDREEYYWFTLCLCSGKREHWIYYPVLNTIIAEYSGERYTIKYLEDMARFDIILIQFTNIDEERDYTNYIGKPIGAERHSDTYYIK